MLVNTSYSSMATLRSIIAPPLLKRQIRTVLPNANDCYYHTVGLLAVFYIHSLRQKGCRRQVVILLTLLSVTH